MITLDDVAARAGVSRMTASNALHGKSVVRPATAARVLAAARELGYQPNLAARQLTRSRTHVIGLTLADIDLGFPADLAAQVSDLAYGRGYQTLVQQTRYSAGHERTLLASASAQVCDGMVVCWPRIAPEEMTAFAAVRPVVAFDGFGMEGLVDCVFTPCEDGSAAAVRHLAAAGCRRILVVGAAWRAPDDLARNAGDSASRRLLGAARALDELGLSYAPDTVLPCGWGRGDEAYALGRRLAERLGADPGAFDGVFCLNDPIALGVLKALTDGGVRVPDDVAVIGFDGSVEGTWTTPGLTSVRVDPRDVADACLGMLVGRIESTPVTRAKPAVGTAPGGQLPPRAETAGFTIETRGSAER
ncbi:LacI family DNA-binding transcriptional regulator [Bifidobacterium avesanii]|uniref:LacI family DNA-binding transcriptional regulator n=1 Tax=Bifidobacterium avesanii TaxID=1798157 RepID=A0A7K3TK79_9BIFI|nr:LacI family DNA-binding transcriptional regulator [Bifidobacterium avesanii]NEG79139.1 LacI family DNA-binding transcriptional regulator [Bifidobacterium avesanii]